MAVLRAYTRCNNTSAPAAKNAERDLKRLSFATRLSIQP